MEDTTITSGLPNIFIGKNNIYNTNSQGTYFYFSNLKFSWLEAYFQDWIIKMLDETFIVLGDIKMKESYEKI
jgi:hypothetical protein